MRGQLNGDITIAIERVAADAEVEKALVLVRASRCYSYPPLALAHLLSCPSVRPNGFSAHPNPQGPAPEDQPILNYGALPAHVHIESRRGKGLP